MAKELKRQKFESNADYLMVSGLCGTGSEARPAEPKAMTPEVPRHPVIKKQKVIRDLRRRRVCSVRFDQMRPALEEESKSVTESNSEDLL